MALISWKMEASTPGLHFSYSLQIVSINLIQRQSTEAGLELLYHINFRLEMDINFGKWAQSDPQDSLQDKDCH